MDNNISQLSLLIIEKLEATEEKLTEINNQMSQPAIMANTAQCIALSKQHKPLQATIDLYNIYKKVCQSIQNTQLLLASEQDEELKDMAREELIDLEQQQLKFENDLKKMLLPKDPNDSKNIVLEIRAGTGGDEAGIFAGDLLRMYRRFADKMQWQVNIVSSVESTSGGYKEIVCEVYGNNVYGTMKYESGVHRVQRTPATETQGRIHTSAASVVVLPEVDDVTVNIDMNDIRKDTFCSSGPGGQSVNTTYSAIRLTHIPTGIVVSCQDEKSQIKNFDKALKVMRARLYEQELSKRQEEIGAERKSMVKRGDRSDKIRTYNYPQSRITDHRIGYTTHNLSAVLDGELADIVEALSIAEEKLSL